MYDQLVAAATILVSLVLVVLIILACWWLMWKVFLSRFEFINELLFPTAATESSAGTTTAEKKRQNLARKKIRKD